MKPLRIGLLGGGIMARTHASVYQLLSNAELVAVYDRTEARAEAIAQPHQATTMTSWESLVQREDVDVIDVCLPTDMHAEASIAAMQAGKAVVCEKPMARSIEDAESMLKVSRETGQPLMIAHCIRFWPEYAFLESVVRAGEYGQLKSLGMRRLGSFPGWSIDRWLEDESRSGGAALDLHIHDTDFALHLLGEPDEFSSQGNQDRFGVSHIVSTFRFGSTIVNIEGGWDLPVGAPFTMSFRAIFDEAAVIWENGPLTIYRPGLTAETPDLVRISGADQGGNIHDLGGYYFELEYFLDCVRHQKPLNRISPESALLTLKTVFAEIEKVKSAV